jgi:hypothetical protein
MLSKLLLPLVLLAYGLLTRKRRINSRNSAPQQQVKTGSERNPTDQQTDNGPPITRAVIQIPETIFEELRTYKQQNDRENRINRRVAVTAVIGAWIVAALSLFQYIEIIKTTKANEKAANAAAAATAAWIVYENWSFEGFNERNQVRFLIHFKNIGKTPAPRVATGWEYHFVLGRNAVGPEYGDWQCPRPTAQPGIIGSDAGWSTLIHSPPYTDVELKMLKDSTARLYIHGCVRYRDVLTERDRITEVAVFYPYPPDLPISQSNSLGIYARYNRMK